MENQTVNIDNKKLYKTLARLALPIAAQGLITQSLNLVDNLMVGQLGELALASVGLSNQVFFLHQMLVFGITSGCATFFAQFWGARDLPNIRRVLGFCFTVTFTFGMLFFIAGFFFPHLILRLFTDNPDIINTGKDFLRILSFSFLSISITYPFMSALRATEQTTIPLYISIVVFCTNTFLGFCLIFGHLGLPALGVPGAALGTLIARTLELILILYVVFGRKNKISGYLSEFFSFDKNLNLKIIKNALPTTINEFMWGLGMTAYAAAYGRLGISEFAAIQAGNTIRTMFMSAIFSMGDATLILVGRRIGRGEPDYAYAKAVKLLKISGILGIISGILLVLFAKYILMLFDFTPIGLFYANRIVLIYGCFNWMSVINGVNITGTLRGGGDTRYAMICEVLAVWLVAVPAVWLGALYFRLPVYWVVLLAQSEEIVKFIVLMRRFVSRKWINNLIHDVRKVLPIH